MFVQLLMKVHLAAQGGYEKFIEVLLKIGADIAAINMDESTALHFAVEGGKPQIVGRC